MRPSFAALAVLALSCNEGAPPPPSSSSLPPGVIARVGEELVAASQVQRIAETQNVSAKQAAERALTDALFAQAARRELPPATGRAIERAAAARSLLEQLALQARQGPPPSAAELTEIVSERWLELQRPDAARTTHAVILSDKPEREADARLVAQELAAALASVKSGEELVSVAKAFPARGFEIRAESLPFVTSDGRTFVRTEGGFTAQRGTFDLAFAKAANAIAHEGQLSPVIQTPFGFHIIRLEERLAGANTSEAELAALVGPEVLVRRASKLRRELLQKLKAGTDVQRERAVDELTAQVEVGR